MAGLIGLRGARGAVGDGCQVFERDDRRLGVHAGHGEVERVRGEPVRVTIEDDSKGPECGQGGGLDLPRRYVPAPRARGVLVPQRCPSLR